MPLPGATVFIKGTYVGSSTNEEGQFEIRKANFASPPVVLVVSFVGYESQELSLSQPDNGISVVLKPSAMLDQVVVSASRVEENIGQVPVTVEKISSRQVEQITTPDIIAGLGRFKSVDISASSMFITAFSTRGFNSSRAERVLQLADYMDTQLPSLSSNFGNLLGIPVLDIESMELLHGPASALYGANAFNGVLLFNSKDPFVSPGLTVRVRGGNRDFFDGQLRYAQKIGEKLAFKISGGYQTANEFIPDNQDPTTLFIEPANNAPGSGLGYDAVNRYGDLGAVTFGPSFRVFNSMTASYQNVPTPAALVGKSLFLPGYTEAQLMADDTKAYSLKVNPSLSYLLTSTIKVTADYKFTQANAVYQNNSRYRFKNSGAHQGRLEVRGRDWFVRGFSTRDFSGGRDPKTDGAYNLAPLGAQLAQQPAPGFLIPLTNPGSNMANGQFRQGSYGEKFVATYQGALAQGASPAQAYQLASATQLQPGSPDFNTARDQLIHTGVAPDGTVQGSRVILHSYLNDVSAQKQFKTNIVDLTVGAAYRQFLLASDRTVFSDGAEGGRIVNYEYGGYAQVTRSLLNDRLRLAAAARVDRFKNFETAFSPRASIVYSAGADKQHNFRASYSRAFRSPTQSDQYVRFDVGRAILLGNVGQGFQGYRTTFTSELPGILGNPTRLATYEFTAEKLRLEEVNTFEGGYRAQLTKQLFADLNYYYSIYDDFIGTQTVISNTDGTRPTTPQLVAAVSAPQGPFRNAALPTRVILAAVNVRQEVRSQGASIGLGYTVNEGLTVTGNYSYNSLLTENLPNGFLSFFNTPEHKFNLGLDGQLMKRRLSYNINYRQTSSFRYESTFAIGDVPVVRTVDAQLGFTFPSLHTTLQAGVTNLFDATNVQVYGAPSIGRMGFFGLLFDIK